MDIREKEVIKLLLDPLKKTKEFRCDVCNKYLSITPILYHEKVGKICGRCVDKVMKNFVDITFQRQIVYEEISKHMHFPCSYQSKGCTETLAIDLVAKHEEVCSFKEDECIFGDNFLKLVGKRCKWRGKSKELICHLKESHSENFQEISSIKISLGPMSESTDRIISTEFMDIFSACLIHVNRHSESLYVHVLMDTTPILCKDLVYDFEVSDEECKNKLNFPGNEVNPLCNIAFTEKFLKTGLDIHIPSLGTLLKSSSFEFSFKVKSSGRDLFEENFKPIKKDDFIFDQKCTKCKHILLPPIFTCYKYHNVCNDCYQNRRCECEEKISSYRNETLEKLCEISLYNCKNKNGGCDELLDCQGLSNHELNCKLTDKPCVVGCDFKGNNFQMLEHVEDKHSLIRLNEEHFFEPKPTGNLLCTIFERNIFIVKIDYKPQVSLSISVNYLATQTGSFLFEFCIFSGCLKVKCTNFCHPILYREKAPKIEPIDIPFDFLKQFLTDQSNFFFKIDIFRTDNSTVFPTNEVTSC